MIIGKNTVVEISYKVEVEGKVVDQRSEARPLDYIQGANMLLPIFEEAVEGHEAGYEFAFTAAPADAYGERDEQQVVEIPKDAFKINGMVNEAILRIGNMIPMYNGQGQVVHGIVSEVRDSVVVMDFNHPMAGKTLSFSGKVISVREATEKELTEGLHGEFLPQQGCGGGCSGGCGGGCNGGCGGGCHGGSEGEGCSCGGDCGCKEN